MHIVRCIFIETKTIGPNHRANFVLYSWLHRIVFPCAIVAAQCEAIGQSGKNASTRRHCLASLCRSTALSFLRFAFIVNRFQFSWLQIHDCHSLWLRKIAVSFRQGFRNESKNIESAGEGRKKMPSNIEKCCVVVFRYRRRRRRRHTPNRSDIPTFF